MSLTVVYGPSNPHEKGLFLSQLHGLRSSWEKEDWILGGGLTLIRNLDEKRGGVTRLNPSSSEFNDVIEEIHLVDIFPKHGLNTWNNQRGGQDHVAS